MAQTVYRVRRARHTWLGRRRRIRRSTKNLPVDDGRPAHVPCRQRGAGSVYVVGVVRPPSANTGSGTGEVIGRLWHRFEVPPLTSSKELDTPLDLGALAVLPGELKPGDPAPDFDVPMFGSGRVRLADYRGKVLLVTFLSSARSSTFAHPAGAKGLYERFRGDPRYAQVGLLSAAIRCSTKKAG